MSLNKNNNNKVSQSKINVGDIVKEIDTKIYSDFLDEYSKVSLSKFPIETLMIIYENGIQLLNDYYIQCQSFTCDPGLTARFQYILGLINHNINMKNYNEVNARVEETRKLNNDMHSTKGKLKNIQKTMKEITTTMISIILAISVIPTALGVVQYLKPEFVLPTITTIIFFGMTMILFVYLIYQIRVNWKVLLIYFGVLVISIILWLLPSWNIKIEMTPKNISSDNTEQVINSGDII